MELVQDRELHEECGVFGIFGVPDAASLTYYGLHALQHRGQEGAGIVAVDNGTFRRIKGNGLVTEVFNEEKLATLRGDMAIGHVHDGRRRRHRERAAVPFPSQFGRFRHGAQREHRQFETPARLP